MTRGLFRREPGRMMAFGAGATIRTDVAVMGGGLAGLDEALVARALELAGDGSCPQLGPTRDELLGLIAQAPA